MRVGKVFVVVSEHLELLERHAPIVRFNEGEYFLPASVESFVQRCELWERTGPAERRQVAAAEPSTSTGSWRPRAA